MLNWVGSVDPFGVNPPLPLLVRIPGNVLGLIGIGLGMFFCVFGRNLFYFVLLWSMKKNMRVGLVLWNPNLENVLRFSGNCLGLFLGYQNYCSCNLFYEKAEMNFKSVIATWDPNFLE